MNPFETEQFLKLKREWDKKLKESGFKDIESDTSKTPRLKKNTSDFENKRAFEVFYEFSLKKSNFKKPVHRAYFKLYCEGLTYKAIAESLKRDKTTIFEVVKRYKKLALKGTK